MAALFLTVLQSRGLIALTAVLYKYITHSTAGVLLCRGLRRNDGVKAESCTCTAAVIKIVVNPETCKMNGAVKRTGIKKRRGACVRNTL